MTNQLAAPMRYLSYPAILTIAANTMNGPGMTTLPDVATDAGLCLYAVLISLSVAMAAFVCRRMVSAMWSSLDSAVIGTKGYDLMKQVTDSTEKAAETDEIIPEAATLQKDEESRLTHRHEPQDGGGPGATEEEAKALLPRELVEAAGPGGQPSLEQTSIVGQSLEAYGRGASFYTALTMVASALCLGLAQMMLCAAILDGMFVAVGGKSCAVGWPSSDGDDGSSSWIHCTSHSSMKPYAGSGAPMSLISVGWVIAASASVAMGTVDLDDMMGMQYLLFGCLIVSVFRFSWVLTSMAHSLPDASDATDEGAPGVSWLVGSNPFQTVGPIMFNFAFIVTSPPSSAMARSEGSAYGALGMSCVVMGLMYAMVGLCGAAVSNAVRNGMVEGGDDSNLLSLILLSGGEGGASMLDLCIIGLFGFSTVASIPVYCLLAKETLINDAGVPRLPSFLLSNVVPWILVALTYNAAFFEAFVNWSGLLILGYSNFSLPLLLDLKLRKVRALRAIGEGVRKLRGDGGGTSAITKAVFVLVTASITLVIVMSIADSLVLAAVAFLCTAGLMVFERGLPRAFNVKPPSARDLGLTRMYFSQANVQV